MNKTRIIGLLIVLTGVAINYFTNSDTMDFLSGILFGFGIALVITGKFVRIKK